MIKTVILDLDGTIYLGRSPINGANEKIEEFRDAGIRTLFLTNSGTKTRQSISRKLGRMGFRIEADDIYTGSYSLAQYAKENRIRSAYVIGEEGLCDDLRAAGVDVVDEDAEMVAASLDRKFSYEKLAKAQKMIFSGAKLIATNHDSTFPVENGLMPGAGSIVSAIESCTNVKAISLGKPNPYAFELMRREKGIEMESTAIIGDRVDTDIMFAKNCGIKSVLVLTGISKKEDAKNLPDYIFESVSVIHDI